MEYIIDIEYDLDYDEEQILDLIRMIRGVGDIEEYNASEEVKRVKAEFKERIARLQAQSDGYKQDYKKLMKELKACREAPKYIRDNADYVELVSLRAENRKLIAFKGILERVQKDIDISRYINDA